MKTDTRVQGTRLVKVACQECGYVIRVTRKWLGAGRPTCCCGGKMLADWDSLKADRDG